MNIHIKRLTAGALALALVYSNVAAAHATFAEANATIGAAYKAVIRIGHGCGDSDSNSIRVSIPEGVIAVKPMPKPGWQISLKTGKYAKSYKYYSHEAAEGVTEITWHQGLLPHNYYDEFVFSAYISDAFKAGSKLYFPVVQGCVKGENPWVNIPAKGEDAHALKFPAPAVHLKAAKQHHHHH